LPHPEGFARTFGVEFLDEVLEAGLRGVLKDGIATQAIGTLTTEPFLVAVALQMGGSNLAVGRQFRSSSYANS
jgi:hypothetical protein